MLSTSSPLSMTPARPAAAVLTLVASHVTGFIHPSVLSLPPAAAASCSSAAAPTTAARAVYLAPHATDAAAAALTTRSHRSIRDSKYSMSLFGDRCQSSGFIHRTALMLQRRRPVGLASSTYAAGAGGAKKAVQLLSVRQICSTTAGSRQLPQVREAAAAGGGGAGGPPVGGYPPPEHLHGVFAVYKPKGFSSNDVVQKIKGVLTRGVREEIQAQLAVERGTAAAPEKEEGEAASSVETRGEGTTATEGLVVAAEGAPGGEDGVGVSRSNGQGDRGGRTQGDAKDPPRKRRRKPQRRRGPKVKVGHGGTLDPMATGVLVIGVGKGCRELGKYLEGGKGYRAEALFGHETDTQDAMGEATEEGSWDHVTTEAVDVALGQFVGDIEQVPPMYSALHKDGKRLYELAREGITVERESRVVTVHSLRQTEPALPLPLLGLELECGGGFYVRTLIEDLARALGSRAHMTALERTKQGPFELKDAVPLPDWEYDKLCKLLGSAEEMADRLALLSEQGEGRDSTTPSLPTVPAEATPVASKG